MGFTSIDGGYLMLKSNKYKTKDVTTANLKILSEK